ncbi:MAG TPA: DUF2911 domain-containing protein [Bacteroidota bacterium]|nr:DUF2911 domain-containing protein [Bacteroidota bacterium]
MKRVIAVLFILVLALLVAGQDAIAQTPQSPPLPLLRIPRISQGAKITQVVGLSEVTIYYHRPGVKGREIWGGLLPYDSVWRAGANEPTLFTFSDEVTIDGKKLPAGTYRFVVFPGRTQWTVVFNSEIKNWGTMYDAQYDVMKFTVKPEAIPHEEWMAFSFTDLTPSSAKVELAWEKMKIGFKIEFNTAGKMQASVGTWQILNSAARYALTEKVFSAEAMGWAERSIAMDKNPVNLGTKAELLAAAGKLKEAIAAAEEAMAVGKAKDAKFETSRQGQGLSRLIGEWKKKM